MPRSMLGLMAESDTVADDHMNWGDLPADGVLVTGQENDEGCHITTNPRCAICGFTDRTSWCCAPVAASQGTP